MRYRPFLAVFVSVIVTLFAVCGSASAASKTPLTYDQIRNTGKAAICPTVGDDARGKIEVPLGKTVKLTDICLQPVRIEVEEEKRNGEKEFIQAKSILLPAASLGPIKAEVSAQDSTTLSLRVTDGMTTQPTTGQMPRRELVPFLFSVKNLQAVAKGSDASINSSTDFEGNFLVPGYHTSQFLDPRGRGSGTGYEVAVGLQGTESDAFETNQKVDEISEGHLSLRIARVDGSTGELAGSFVSLQPSSTEQGALESKLVRVQGLFYGRVDS
ncbi:MAG: photosystem II manganese-stabilizing polypeptide [Cyanobacteriota bacterium]|nr:photosystem II manganese-stabilizing polypeptide [Cyanobacteriota bacterium]